MVKLNKSTRFALYAIVELSSNPDGVVSAGEIAEKYHISEHHVAKVLQQLVRARLIRSIRGIKGGFQIAKDPKEITMLDIVELFEPQAPQNGCLLLDYEESCELEGVCRIGEVFNEIQEQAIYTLKSVSIATLISPKRIS
ncbi:Rrf2 family transcriptional regulator [candidate division KSB1 bacterium]|nr:Rrf2 family transcriptional regulator [candidate division KSB1 bacterium]